jgi:hypothetical protein
MIIGDGESTKKDTPAFRAGEILVLQCLRAGSSSKEMSVAHRYPV